MATTSSMIAELPASPDEPARAWAAAGSPCVSVYMPCLIDPQLVVPSALCEADYWQDHARLRDWAQHDPDALGVIRDVLDPVEAAQWDEADATAEDPGHFGVAADRWSREIREIVAKLVP